MWYKTTTTIVSTRRTTRSQFVNSRQGDSDRCFGRKKKSQSVRGKLSGRLEFGDFLLSIRNQFVSLKQPRFDGNISLHFRRYQLSCSRYPAVRYSVISKDRLYFSLKIFFLIEACFVFHNCLFSFFIHFLFLRV